MPKLPKIMETLINEAKAEPGTSRRQVLGKGLQAIVKVKPRESGNPHLIVGCCRANVDPSPAEFVTVLRDACSPMLAREPGNWGRGEKAGYIYLWASWELLPDPEQIDLLSHKATDADWEAAGEELMEAEAKQFEKQFSDEDVAHMIANMIIVRKAIIEKAEGKRGVAGIIACPLCKTGEVHFSIAQLNGHVHAACTTKGCVSWLE